MALSTLNVSELDGTQGFVISGINFYESSGYSVSNAGDIEDVNSNLSLQDSAFTFV